jgi:PPK2 family polyphosphate:nucleotide phosphotransferase
MKAKQFRVRPGRPVSLSKIDPADTSAWPGDKDSAVKEIERYTEQLDRFQELLFADHGRSLLVVLQAMDTGGKDGTIRHVFRGVNPQGVRVAQFKAPSPEELSHDFLWRVHRQVPAKGEIVIFNRSQYEDVLIARVHRLVPPGILRHRYDEINEFERELVDSGTAVVKFYFHISEQEQKRRLQARLDDPGKRWKFSLADLKERHFWPQYTRAYAEALTRTSTSWAPWYIVPANHKWFRDLVVSCVLVETLKGMDLQLPKPARGLSSIRLN